MKYFIVLLTVLSALQGVAQYESPLDEWYRTQSIMNSDDPSNQYYTGLDAYAPEQDYSYNQCAACQQPNPPWFCSDPNHECYDAAASVPIDSGIVFLIIAGVSLAIFHLRQPVMG